jgi:hypothetical protein
MKVFYKVWVESTTLILNIQENQQNRSRFQVDLTKEKKTRREQRHCRKAIRVEGAKESFLVLYALDLPSHYKVHWLKTQAKYYHKRERIFRLN